MHLKPTYWQTSRFRIDLDAPKVMGIVNLTPDSFSDGGRLAGPVAALRHCEQLLAAGAHILDLGAESSRPGAAMLPVADELARLLPVLRDATALGVPVSVDTYKPQVIQAALDLGADIVNDIWALRWHDADAGEPPGAAAAVVAAHPDCGVCLMHMHGEPATMQREPMHGDVLADVQAFLAQAAAQLEARGVAPQRIVLDPGIGFGKTVAQNFALLRHQRELSAARHAWLVGWSRKSSLAAVSGGPMQAPADRVTESVTAAVLAVERGARIVRVHDVRETVAALNVWHAATAPCPSNPKESSST
ncbi:dihydropteroate synthase [Pseudorhodoferax sp. Leaf267]|uniref:dihydropteroate synthase n=1 Tax=Pseudorhodoferax sp. Leaf267 TaxID=1736316 RepID=UPI0006FE5D24|nr:dihydropteroate synthase [Pseudorhodoferax sp. Leaf267]KQP17749.1 dihydropteroate synthase [Pseudorhodoferax sp. Leaf267]